MKPQTNLKKNKKTIKGLLLGAFAVSACIISLPYVLTETSGTDVCLASARLISNAIHLEESFVAEGSDTNRYTTLITTDASGGDWKIRLALTPFPFTKAVHTSLELVPASAEGPSRKFDEYYQIHGVIRKASDNSPAGIRPCDATSLIRQFTGGHILQGVIVQSDLNLKLLGRDPVTYVDLVSGDKGGMLEKLEEIRDAIEAFNRNRLTYGFIDEPNSNTFIFSLLDTLDMVPENKLFTPRLDSAVPYWAPGFKNYPQPVPASATESVDKPDPLPGA